MSRTIFVFGSNLAGRHGKGSALVAKQCYGAITGQGVGLQGSSYAIPTKDSQLKTLPICEIDPHVENFITFAKQHPDWKFDIVRIDFRLAGYTDAQIAPLFRGAPPNCLFEPEWEMFLK